MVVDLTNPITGTAGPLNTPRFPLPQGGIQPTFTPPYFGPGYGPGYAAINPGFFGPGFGPGAFNPVFNPALNPALNATYGVFPPRPDMYSMGWFDPTVYGTTYTRTPLGGGFSPAMYGTSPTTGEQLGDREIEGLVDEVLSVDPLTCNADIQVQCQGHVITLTGNVASRLTKIAVGNDAWMVPGVRDVNNNIEIKSRSSHGQKRQTTGAGSR
jgi:hypothetical protein